MQHVGSGSGGGGLVSCVGAAGALSWVSTSQVGVQLSPGGVGGRTPGAVAMTRESGAML